MITKKIFAMMFSSAILFVLPPTPVSAAERIKVVDRFEYATVDQLKTQWTITATGFSGPIEIRFNTKDAKEGRQCLELILPPTGKAGLARITLDIFPKVNAKDIAQVRFGVLADLPDSIYQSGLYWGDKEWKNFFALYSFYIKQNSWQKVYASQSEFTKADGSPDWKTVSQMRISLWFLPNQPANRILIDEVAWDSGKEKSMNLNRNWWDYSGLQ